VIADTARIHPSARIATGVSIGDYTIIGEDVEIGEGCKIGPHVVIHGPTKLGANNKIYQFASLGEDPQDKKYAGEKTRLEIGDGNTFREFTTISRGTTQGGGLTKIGNHNLFMAYVHIAHDCKVEDYTVFSNNASLAGHVSVGNYANLSGFVGVHQFCRIGAYSFCAGGSIIVKDVLPYLMVSGHPAQVFGLNIEGLKRRDFSAEVITALKRAYKVVYRQGLTLESALEKLIEMARETPEIQSFIDYIQTSERGIVR
jgi:UDP-N-acetylglucosamine acyltransferase